MNYKQLTAIITFLIFNLLFNLSCSKQEIRCDWKDASIEEQLAYCLKKANEGDIIAQRYVADNYNTAVTFFGVTHRKTDNNEALKWYAKALAQGITKGQTEKDIALIKSRQIDIYGEILKSTSDEKVFKKIESLAHGGEPAAIKWMQRAYDRGLERKNDGIDIEASRTKYTKYTILAAEQGIVEEMKHAGDLLSTKVWFSTSPDKGYIDYDEALKWYKKYAVLNPKDKKIQEKIANITKENTSARAESKKEKYIANLKSTQGNVALFNNIEYECKQYEKIIFPDINSTQHKKTTLGDDAKQYTVKKVNNIIKAWVSGNPNLEVSVNGAVYEKTTNEAPTVSDAFAAALFKVKIVSEYYRTPSKSNAEDLFYTGNNEVVTHVSSTESNNIRTIFKANCEIKELISHPAK